LGASIGKEEKKEGKVKPSSSLLYWYPKIKDLPIPQPRTIIYEIPKKYIDENIWINYDTVWKFLREHEERLKECARKIGYPLFVRTDLASGKHSWNRTCYVEKEDELIKHIFNVIDFNMCADFFGLPFRAIVFREFIEGECYFKAFSGDMPVNKEVRVFIKDGKVLCHHFYWIEEAIEKTSYKPKNWKELLNKAKQLSKEDIDTILKYAGMVAKVISGYWSVDFMKAKNGKWYLIDMALGKESWHPPCKYKLTKDPYGP